MAILTSAIEKPETEMQKALVEAQGARRALEVLISRAAETLREGLRTGNEKLAIESALRDLKRKTP